MRSKGIKINKAKFTMAMGLIVFLTIPTAPVSLLAQNIQENLPFSTMIALDRAQKLVQEEKMPQAIGALEKMKAESFLPEVPQKVLVDDIMSVRETAHHLISGF